MALVNILIVSLEDVKMKGPFIVVAPAPLASSGLVRSRAVNYWHCLPSHARYLDRLDLLKDNDLY